MIERIELGGKQNRRRFAVGSNDYEDGINPSV